MWDLETRRPLGETLTGHEGAVRAVAFSLDGTVPATGSHADTVRLWVIPASVRRPSRADVPPA
ncbi:hypothetical protein [Streptomyces sp. NPDC093094]|uniref:hypothetical protein n=1 Tax=Streptomyces sp. NPDC093094 TaxID=3366026 RepID=UPI0038220C79